MANGKENAKSDDSGVAEKSTIVEKIKSSSAKKISALVGFVAVFIGLVAGSTGLVKEYLATRELNREIAMHIEVGDRFVEQYKLNDGLAEYEKALEKDADNTTAHRRIISAMRIKYEVRNEPIPRVEDVQTRIYQLQALHPELKDDVQLTVDEARVISYNHEPHSDPFNRAIQIMESAFEIAPENPEVIAQLGLLRALDSPIGQTEGLDLIRRAVDLMPDEHRYHSYFARASIRAEAYNKAANEYYAALLLTTDNNLGIRSSRNWIITRLTNLLWFVFHQEGALTSTLDLSFEERLQVLELFESSELQLPYHSDYKFSFYEPGKIQRPVYLAELYDALGYHLRADSLMAPILDPKYKYYINRGLFFQLNNAEPGYRADYWEDLRHVFKSGSPYHELLIQQQLVNFHIKIMEAAHRDSIWINKAVRFLQEI